LTPCFVCLGHHNKTPNWWLKKQKSISSQSWKLDISVCGEHCLPMVQTAMFSLWPDSHDFLALWRENDVLGSPSANQDMNSIRLRFTVFPSWPLSPPPRLFCPNRVTLGFRDLTHEGGGGTIQSMKLSQMKTTESRSSSEELDIGI
jgi:hypothetical protein